MKAMGCTAPLKLQILDVDEPEPGGGKVLQRLIDGYF